MKCAHPENKGNPCSPEKCPRGYFKSDWEELVDPENDYLCSYRRTNRWKFESVEVVEEETKNR